MKRLEGKTAFITGGGAGLGRAMALAFAREGAVVGVADIDEAAAMATAAEAGNDSLGYACDVSRRDQVRQAVDDFATRAGGLDILVNNAVAFHYAPLVDMPEEVIDRMLDVGIKGTYWALQAATPHLVARGGGASVINLSSVAVSFAIKNAAVYSSIKGAIDTLTRQQACELGPQGVRVNALAPGPVETPGASAVIDEAGWAARRARTPIRRLATAEDVAEAAVFLASAQAQSIAGVTLKIDGGVTVAGP
ncbi:MAG: SDR family oxidoreductase [Tistlia sp.]|uniref:SDR family NAD(P)-dependent oxidoreductase n=1 Tax=Tistlia sp. TaxID=3057121 RepID=UPI0034A2CB2D